MSRKQSALFHKVMTLGFELAKSEGLHLNSIAILEKDKKVVGKCWPYQGRVEIKITFPRQMEEFRIEQEMYRTLSHELAHFRFGNHDKEFYEYAKVLTEKISDKIGKRINPEKWMMR